MKDRITTYGVMMNVKTDIGVGTRDEEWGERL